MSPSFDQGGILAIGLKSSQLQALARLGAAARIAELRAEITAIEKAFGSGTAHSRQRSGRRKRHVSAAARERMRQAQLRRWAAVKAGKKR